MKLLIVEDNVKLMEAIGDTLQDAGFLCETAENYIIASEKIAVYLYDIMVVDINLPDGSGLDLIKEMKHSHPNTGIIIISARDSLNNKIEGLELGADDYLTKPFDMAELLARINSIVRRRVFGGNQKLTVGPLTIDTTSREVNLNGEHIELTKSEFDILMFFISSNGRVLTKESIAEHIYGDNLDLLNSFDFIYSHIKNLRKKIATHDYPSPIRAVYGIGYKFDLQNRIDEAD
jgi:DNA-binding response OmpR family regulator